MMDFSSPGRTSRFTENPGLSGDIPLDVVGVPESMSNEGRLWSDELRLTKCPARSVLNMVDTGRILRPRKSADPGGALLGGFKPSTHESGFVVAVVGVNELPTCVTSLALGEAELALDCELRLLGEEEDVTIDSPGAFRRALSCSLTVP